MGLNFAFAIIPAHDAYLAARYGSEFDHYAATDEDADSAGLLIDVVARAAAARAAGRASPREPWSVPSPDL